MSRCVTTGACGCPRSVRSRSIKAHNIDPTKRDYYLERRYPTFGNLVPRDVASRNAKMMTDEGIGVGPEPHRLAVYLDFRDAIERLGEHTIDERYGNLFDIYKEITGRESLQGPHEDLPRRALHHGRAVGGLQPDDQRAWPLRASARPTSRITAQTASARPR